MADFPDNPYAPPSAEIGSVAVDTTQSWSVEGDYLMVRPDTQLPPLPLQGEGTWLTPGVRRFAVLSGGRGLAFAIIPGLLAGGWVFASKYFFHGRYFWAGLVVIVILIQLLGRGSASGSTASASVKGFFPLESLRAGLRRKLWFKRMLCFGLLLMGIGCLLTTSARSYVGLGGRYDYTGYLGWAGGFMLFGVIFMLGSLVSRTTVASELRATGHRNGWLYLRGVPRETLAILAAKSREEPPPLRKRKVVRFYQYRLPLSLLLHRNWLNPWLVFWLTYFKFTRSKNLVRLRFVDREQTVLREADPELLRRWEEGSRGTPLADWQALGQDCQDSPQGDMRILTLMHGDPDGRIFCYSIAVRVSVMNVFTETYQTSFQSWTEDGRLISTTSPPKAFATPPHMEVRTVSGNLETIYRAHLARVSSLALMTLRDKDQFAQVNAREVDLVHEFYEAAGYQSAPEEIDWRDVPA